MDINKVAEAVPEVLRRITVMDLDPAEKCAVLRSAAGVIEQTLMAEGMKASMANWMKIVFDSNKKE